MYCFILVTNRASARISPFAVTRQGAGGWNRAGTCKPCTEKHCAPQSNHMICWDPVRKVRSADHGQTDARSSPHEHSGAPTRAPEARVRVFWGNVLAFREWHGLVETSSQQHADLGGELCAEPRLLVLGTGACQRGAGGGACRPRRPRQPAQHPKSVSRAAAYNSAGFSGSLLMRITWRSPALLVGGQHLCKQHGGPSPRSGHSAESA